MMENNPFKKYLFETALEKGKTEISNSEKFGQAVEVYKKVKEGLYLESGDIVVKVPNTEKTEKLTRDEAALFVSTMENKVKDIQELLKEIRGKLTEKKEKKPVVVYTCITGGYDVLKDPTFVTPDVDYVCFTDNPAIQSKVWKVRPIPEELLKFSKVKQQRAVKILAHRYLSDYSISVWVDGIVDTKGNVADYLKTLDFGQFSVFIPEHPQRKCIYKEKDECVRQRKITGDGLALAEKQMKKYRNEGFPENYGLVQTNVMVRQHNDPYCKELMEKWWDELKNYSHRDQLSFNYALWKIGEQKFKYLIKTTCNSRTFSWGRRHTGR